MSLPQAVKYYVKAEPYRPFRLQMASGRTYDVRHPEIVKNMLQNNLIVFKSTSADAEFPDEWESVSLMLTEAISHCEPSLR